VDVPIEIAPKDQQIHQVAGGLLAEPEVVDDRRQGDAVTEVALIRHGPFARRSS
jgi:hypothetical protein